MNRKQIELNKLLGPPDLAMIEFVERGFSFWPTKLKPEGYERLKMHHDLQMKEECHRYASLLYCYCGECK